MLIGRFCSALLLGSFAFAAQAKMVHQPVSWTDGGVVDQHAAEADAAVSAKRPVLVMVPNWYGVNDAAV